MSTEPASRVVVVHGPAGALLEATLTLMGLEPAVTLDLVTVWTPTTPEEGYGSPVRFCRRSPTVQSGRRHPEPGDQ